MHGTIPIKLFVRVFLSLLTLCLVHTTAAAQTVTWNNWTFDYEVSGNFDGLSLQNVKYGGRTLIYKISLPVMRSFYTNNACGPYADRLGGQLSPIPWANNATIAQREFTINGRQWYEIGIRDQIGSQDIYQVYYLSNDGILDAHIYTKGSQCGADHINYPNWRIDFDVDGFGNDMVEHSTGTSFQVNNTEFDANVTTAVNHGWRVGDTGTGLYIDILPGFTDFSIPNETHTPTIDYSQNTIFGRTYSSSEDTG
ncbi:MAG: hypothetical protein AB7G75_17740 [Candidatus Binatia bacterium]